MSTSTLTPTYADEIATELEARGQEHELAYRELVLETAAGKRLPADKVIKIRTAANRTHEEFREHLTRAIERKAAADAIATSEPDESQLEELRTELTEVGDLIATEKARHRTEMDPLTLRRDKVATELNKLQRSGRGGKIEAMNLLSTNMSPEFRKRFDELSNRSCQLARRLQETERDEPKLKQQQIEAERTIKALEAKRERLEQTGTMFTDGDRQKLEGELAYQRQLKHEAEYNLAEIDELKKLVPESKAELEKFASEGILNWRDMKFD